LACLFALRKQIFLFGIGGKPEWGVHLASVSN
jgi:hypothetical protein